MKSLVFRVSCVALHPEERSAKSDTASTGEMVDILPILPMDSRNVRPVAGTIQSHSVSGRTACPGILAEPCKHGANSILRAGSIGGGTKIGVR